MTTLSLEEEKDLKSFVKWLLILQEIMNMKILKS